MADAFPGRIYKITHGQPEKTPVDLTRLSDEELVKLQLHRNDWYVRHARRLLQERAGNKEWQGRPVHDALHQLLAAPQLDAPQRLRVLWALPKTQHRSTH